MYRFDTRNDKKYENFNQSRLSSNNQNTFISKPSLAKHKTEKDESIDGNSKAEISENLQSSESLVDGNNTKMNKSYKWGQKQDKEAFKIINENLDKYNLTLDDFFVCSRETRAPIMVLIVQSLKWSQAFDCLFERLKKVYENRFMMSTRKINLLKKFGKKCKNSSLKDHERMWYDFPGTTFEYFRELVLEYSE